MHSSLLVGGSPGRENRKGFLGGISCRELWEEVLGRDISSGIPDTHELDTTIAKFATSYSSKKDGNQEKAKVCNGSSSRMALVKQKPALKGCSQNAQRYMWLGPALWICGRQWISSYEFWKILDLMI